MKETYYWTISPNGNVVAHITTSEIELTKAKANNMIVSMNRMEAFRLAREIKAKGKTETETENSFSYRYKRISDERLMEIEKEQLAFGRERMTEEDWAILKEKRKSIDEVQREFGLMMMKSEMAFA